jgi:glycosyltransferase involved in cell wall biosynthesis
LPQRSKFRVAFVPTSNAGVNYYRMAAWAFEMRKYRNVEAPLFAFQYQMDLVHPWQQDFISVPEVREHIESLHRVADVVVWQPVHYDHTLDFFNEMHQKYGKTTIIETDDNYCDVPPWNEAYFSFAPNSRHRQVAIECMRMADGMTVTTPHLKELYGRYCENIEVLPNSLDFKGDRKFVGWDKASPKKHKGIRIGWIGGRSHFADLMMVAPALREVLERNENVQLTLVNSAVKQSCAILGRKYPFYGLDNVQECDRSVPINRYAEFMAYFGFDIGLAPLVDCNFNRSKSNLRWLEYAGLGIPCVATDISHFSQTITHGIDGILVQENKLSVWAYWIEKLIKEPLLREQIGRNAKKRAKQDFNIVKNAPKYVRHLKTISQFTGMDPEYQEDASWINRAPAYATN